MRWCVEAYGPLYLCVKRLLNQLLARNASCGQQQPTVLYALPAINLRKEGFGAKIHLPLLLRQPERHGKYVKQSNNNGNKSNTFSDFKPLCNTTLVLTIKSNKMGGKKIAVKFIF